MTSKYIHMRMEDSDKQLIAAAAAACGMSMSEYVRLVAAITSTGVLNVSERDDSLERLAQVLDTYRKLEKQRLSGLSGEKHEGKT